MTTYQNVESVTLLPQIQKEIQISGVRQLEISYELARKISKNCLPGGACGDPNFIANKTTFHIPSSEWHVDLSGVDRELKSVNGCTVYSFGIAQDDKFTNFMAKRGCNVFAFDPTVDHPKHWKNNVIFHPWGIRNGANATEWSHSMYGNTSKGLLLTIPQIMARLGHDDGRTIAAIKFDCEGCEFGAFADIVRHEKKTKTVFNQILSLSTEFHLSVTLGLKDKEDIANMHYLQSFLDSQSCTTVHFAANRGFTRDRTEYKMEFAAMSMVFHAITEQAGLTVPRVPRSEADERNFIKCRIR